MPRAPRRKRRVVSGGTTTPHQRKPGKADGEHADRGRGGNWGVPRFKNQPNGVDGHIVAGGAVEGELQGAGDGPDRHRQC